jgi:hypothetical protein
MKGTGVSNPTTAQKAKADKIGGLVVQHLDDDEVTVVERFELDFPARAQRVLYVADPVPTEETDD